MSLRDLILVLIVCLAWAFNFIASAKGMEHFSPFLFLAIRFAILLLFMAPFLRWPPPGQWFRLVAVALCIGALHFLTLLWALAKSEDVTSVAIALQTYIPMAVLVAMIFLGERVGWRSLSAIFVAFAGVLVISFDPMVFSQMDVLVISLASALFHAVGSTFMRRIHGVSTFSFQAWTAVFALPLMLAASWLTEDGQLHTMQTAEWLHWASVLYSALIASIVGHGLFFVLVQRNPVTTVMPYLLLMPLMAVVFGILVWGDQPGGRLLAGGALVLLGILAITLRAKRKSLKTAVQTSIV
jgi:O-acetylserine/cysteine efflux transporter